MITHPCRSILGPVPADWDVVSLREIVKRSGSGDWGDDRNEVSGYVLRSTNFTPTRSLDYTDVALRWFGRDRLRDFDVQPGDILIERSGGGPTQPVGRVVVADERAAGCGYSNFVQLIRIDDEQMYPDFAAWCLYQLHKSGVVERLQHQTTQMRNLDFRDYMRVLVPRPPRPEQERIADAISAADRALAATENQLAKTDRMRRALLQTLFTSGMPGTHAEFRSVRVLRKGHLIPSTWDFTKLGGLVDKVDYGTNAKSNEHAGYPVIAIPQIVAPVLRRDESWPLADISSAEADQLRLESGDVLLVRTNGNSEYIGKATVIPQSLTSEHLVFASYLIRARTDADKLLGEYLNLFLASPLGRRQLLAKANTSAGNHNLGSRSLRQILIALPCIEEQRAIVQLVSAVEGLGDAVRGKLRAANVLKRSLVQNLVTGAVRFGGGSAS